MNLTEDQKNAVSKWIAEEVSLSEIQRRLASEYGMNVTYMEARLLMTELNLVPAEKKKEEQPAQEPSADSSVSEIPPAMPMDAEDGVGNPPPGAGGVKVSIDQITKPNALISGKVTFSDGVNSDWSLDSMGRLALSPSTPGYRPSPADITAFQMELQRLASSQGF